MSGRKYRLKEWTPEQDKELKELWFGPYSLQEIREFLGRPYQDVRGRAVHLGFPDKMSGKKGGPVSDKSKLAWRACNCCRQQFLSEDVRFNIICGPCKKEYA